MQRFRSEEASFVSKLKLKQLLKTLDIGLLFEKYNEVNKISAEEKPKLPLSALKTILSPYLKEQTICEIINCFRHRSINHYKLEKLCEDVPEIPEWVYRGTNAPKMNFKVFSNWLD